jgi:hypothetical protein
MMYVLSNGMIARDSIDQRGLPVPLRTGWVVLESMKSLYGCKSFISNEKRLSSGTTGSVGDGEQDEGDHLGPRMGFGAVEGTNALVDICMQSFNLTVCSGE